MAKARCPYCGWEAQADPAPKGLLPPDQRPDVPDTPSAELTPELLGEALQRAGRYAEPAPAPGGLTPERIAELLAEGAELRRSVMAALEPMLRGDNMPAPAPGEDARAEIGRALNALRLEVAGEIVDDVERHVLRYGDRRAAEARMQAEGLSVQEIAESMKEYRDAARE